MISYYTLLFGIIAILHTSRDVKVYSVLSGALYLLSKPFRLSLGIDGADLYVYYFYYTLILLLAAFWIVDKQQRYFITSLCGVGMVTEACSFVVYSTIGVQPGVYLEVNSVLSELTIVGLLFNISIGWRMWCSVFVVFTSQLYVKGFFVGIL